MPAQLPPDAYAWSAQEVRECVHDRPKILSVDEAISELAPYLAASAETARKMERATPRRNRTARLMAQPFRVRRLLDAEARALGERLRAPASAEDAARVLAHLERLEIWQLHVLLTYRTSHLGWLAELGAQYGQCLLLVDPVWRFRLCDYLEGQPLHCAFVYSWSYPQHPPLPIEPFVKPD